MDLYEIMFATPIFGMYISNKLTIYDLSWKLKIARRNRGAKDKYFLQVSKGSWITAKVKLTKIHSILQYKNCPNPNVNVNGQRILWKSTSYMEMS